MGTRQPKQPSPPAQPNVQAQVRYAPPMPPPYPPAQGYIPPYPNVPEMMPSPNLGFPGGIPGQYPTTPGGFPGGIPGQLPTTPGGFPGGIPGQLPTTPGGFPGVYPGITPRPSAPYPGAVGGLPTMFPGPAGYPPAPNLSVIPPQAGLGDTNLPPYQLPGQTPAGVFPGQTGLNPFGTSNALRDYDYYYLAMLSGLSVPTIQQLANEFNHLTMGTGRLDRDQYRRLFFDNIQVHALHNLDQMAEMSFREFDRDNNGCLDFTEFVAAYKNSTNGIPSNILLPVH